MFGRRKRGREADETATTPAEVAATPPVKAERPLGAREPVALRERPLIKTGIYAWAFLGVLLVLIAAWIVVSRVRLVAIPLILALFPAAVLAPPTTWLKTRKVPAALAALLTILGSSTVLGLILAFITPQVSAELGDFGELVQEGIAQLRRFLAGGPFGLDPVRLEDLIERARQQLTESQGLGASALEALLVVVEGFAGLILGLIALFFYLKDGPRLGEWLKSLFPERMQADAAAIGVRAWQTIGDYIRGQMVIALADAIMIGIGLAFLRVPLLLPLVVVIFLGGLFPIVGAFISGFLAVIVALADQGFATALLVLALIIVVQQIEGHVLAPVVLGKATELHPLATLAALTAGGVLLGILGAFLAIPIAASGARAVGYLRQRAPG